MIVNVGSDAAFAAQQHAAVYSATKAALVGLTKGLATVSLLENDFPGAPSFKSCPKASAASLAGAHAAKLSSKVLQTLKANERGGRFRTRGRYSAGTVRGTVWDTIDRCDGTLTRVEQGSVAVRNRATGTMVTLHAGQSYLAKAHGTSGS